MVPLISWAVGAVISLIVSGPTTHPPKSGSLEVTVRNGTLRGASWRDGAQDFFGGIPYASPPKRFERARPADTYGDSVLDATSYGSACYGIGNDQFEQSEDCLFLNIIRPSGTHESSKLPVMVWAHGGGFGSGSGHVPVENGTNLVQTSIEMGKPMKVVRLNGSQIFVSINYRLLLLGFPAGTEAREGGFMNLGLHDQRLALQWIQENIVTFGGDPRRVTFSGESAGGTAILQHLVAYNGRDDHLFSAAIVQSGSFFDMRCHWNISDIRQAEYERLLADTECKEGGWDCLKEMDIKVLAEVSQRYYRLSTPAIDGDLLPVHAVELWANGSFLKVPLLMGSNQDEGVGLSPKGRENDSMLLDGLVEVNATSFVIREDAFPDLLKAYPDDPAQGSPLRTGRGLLPSGKQDKRMNVMFTDALLGAARRWITRLMAEAGQPTFSYHFRQMSYRSSILEGVPHYAEIHYVFSDPTSQHFEPSSTDGTLSNIMRRAWISFVVDHDPNHGLMARWPDYRAERANMAFEAGATEAEADNFRSEGMEIWIRERIEGCTGLRA